MDLVGTVVEVIDPHGTSTKYEYDPRSLQPTVVTDPSGGTSRLEYDERGQCIRIEAPGGGITTFSYDERFLECPVLSTTPGGSEWRWAYDGFGRLTGHANPFGHWRRYEYEDGHLTSVATPGGAVTRLHYDEQGVLGSVSTPGGLELRMTYDRLGRALKLTNSRGAVERRTFDIAGNLVRAEYGHGVTARFEYDRERNLTRAVDDQRDVSFSYTGHYRVHERAEAGQVVRFHYNTEDDLIVVENEAGERYELERDERGLVRRECGFDGAELRYRRDLAGRVVLITRSDGTTTAVTRDSEGRVSRAEHSDGSFERYVYGPEGELREATNDDAELHLEYDPIGKLLRETVRLPDGTERWVRSGYGPDGHRVRVESSGGHLHHIERDAAGGVRRLELEGGRWGVDFERDPFGLELARRFPNGVESRWERDSVGRPQRRTVTWRNPDGETKLIGDKWFEWRGDDMIAAIRDSQLGETRYARDRRGRLTFARLPWGEEQHRAMDAVGNVYRHPDLSDRSYGQGGRILESDGTRYGHDEAGRLRDKTDVLGDTTRYEWNGSGRLCAVALPDGRRVEFTYDALGRRLSKRVVEGDSAEPQITREVRWQWDGGNPLVELDSDAGMSTWIFEPETFSPLAKLADGKVWGVLTDQLGAPTELIAADGSVAACVLPDLFGPQSGDAHEHGLTWGWPGQQRDPETGLLYNRFRYFDPDLSSYISPDPLGLAGGLRAYGYVDDPLVQYDPLGLAVCHHRGSGDDMVRRLEQELDCATQHANRMLDAGLHGNTVWGRLYQNVFRGTPLEAMARGNAVQQISEGIVRRGSAVQDIAAAGGRVLFNEGSVTGARSARGRLLRPDVQVRMPGGTTHILDITTPGQSAAGKIWKYDGAGVGGLTDITY